MDMYSSGEDLVAKTRKPYTITKQRERWTDEEHNRFLEALKLYGRAWQRIEEHIGTKTAVQIRSHAQKFFSKLEKEALVKGIPIGQAIDIEIPPPRPKRKPNNPYPRNNGAVNAPTTQVGVKDGKLGTSGSSHPGKQVLDLEKEPLPEKSIVDGGEEDRQDNHGNDLCSEFTIYQETPSTFASAANKSSGISKAYAKDSCNFTEFIPLVKNVVNKDISSESHLADGAVAMDVLQNNGTENEMQGAKNFPRHVPVHILDGSARTCSQALSSDISFQESAYQPMGGAHHAHPAVFANPAVSPTTESTSRPANHHKLSSFHPPFHPFRGTQEDYASLLQMSSTFSSLIVSTLLQNPAAHAAAIFAASFWPCTNAETSTDSHHGAIGGFPPKPINPTPGMTAIASATVAAATAWWAAHGLLPVCPPYHHAGFTCPPATTATTAHNTCHPAAVNVGGEENNNIQNHSFQEQQLEHTQNSELKSPTASSSDSGDQSCPKGNYVLTSNDDEKNNPSGMEQKDSNKNKNIKLVDRSSCGSNSSSEADALEKHEEDKEENKEADADQAAGESSSRRSKNSSSFNDSWKEVSDVGRMAFQALFLREILPQSFSPPHVLKKEAEHAKMNEDQNRQIGEQRNEGTSLNLNSNITESCSSHHETEKNRMAGDIEANEGLPTIGLSQGKLKARRTGFKPYKRCSMEARESIIPNTGSQDQEKGPKRLRLGEEALS